ncbi:unnamed protein product [Gordionus sp. m RMFG-2023]
MINTNHGCAIIVDRYPFVNGKGFHRNLDLFITFRSKKCYPIFNDHNDYHPFNLTYTKSLRNIYLIIDILLREDLYVLKSELELLSHYNDDDYIFISHIMTVPDVNELDIENMSPPFSHDDISHFKYFRLSLTLTLRILLNSERSWYIIRKEDILIKIPVHFKYHPAHVKSGYLNLSLGLNFGKELTSYSPLAIVRDLMFIQENKICCNVIPLRNSHYLLILKTSNLGLLSNISSLPIGDISHLEFVNAVSNVLILFAFILIMYVNFKS